MPRVLPPVRAMEAKLGDVLVCNLDDDVIVALQSRALAKGVSLEAELRDVLTTAARPSRAELLEELKAIRGMTPEAPKGTYMLAEDFIREMRDER